MIKGVFTDVEVNNQPPEFARFLKNVLLTEKLGTPINEPGFTVCVGEEAIPYDVNGVYVIDEAIVLWSTDNTTSEIGIVEDCLYKTIVNDADFTEPLNFSTNFPIDAQHYLNFNSERVVAWIDDINSPRILNIDNFDVQELNDIRIFPFANTPNLDFEVKDSGGTLHSGTHQIVVSYANTNGLETNWFQIGKPISITDDPLTVGFREYDGVEADTNTSKAIQITVEDADTRFELMRIGVVKTINSIVTAQFVKSIPIAETNFSTIYTGSEGTIEDITLDEILVPSASYKTAKAIGQVNNKLYLANLTVDEEIDLTEVATNVKLEWEASILQDATSLTVGAGSQKNPNTEVGFWPGEVYAFYLVGEKLDGTTTQAFHIPGRASVAEDFLLNSAAATGQLTDNPKNYEVDSTVQNVVSQFSGTSFKGDFGYWENKNEDYSAGPISTIETQTLPASVVALSAGSEVIVRLTESASTNVGGSGTPLVQSILTGQQVMTMVALDGGDPTDIQQLPFTVEASNATAGTIDLNFGKLGVDIANKFYNLFAYIPTSGGSTEWQGPIVYLDDILLTVDRIVVDVTTAAFKALPAIGEKATLAGFTAGNGIYTISNIFLDPVGEAFFVVEFLEGESNIAGSGTFSSETIVESSSGLTGPVRHHRFPTLNKLASLSGASIGKAFFPRLSVVASNVNIPVELQGKITKWFITWAKRTPANATVMGQAPYQYAGLDEEDYTSAPANTGLGKKFSPSTGNLVIGNTNQTGGDGEQTGRNDAQRFIHQEIIKFNSFELIYGKPSMGSLYLRQEVKLVATDAFVDNRSIGGIGDLDSGVYSNPAADNGVNLARWHFQNKERQYTSSPTNISSLLREVSNYSYQPANTIDLSALGVGCDLRSGEESLYLKVKGGQPTNTVPNFSISPDPNGIPDVDIEIAYRMPGNNSLATASTQEDTFLSTLCQRKDNVYTPFTEQQQVLCVGKFLSAETTGVFFGGDARVSFTGIKQLAPYAAHNKFRDFYNSQNAQGAGVMSITYFGSYSTKNIGLRHLDNSKISSFYFPKVNDWYNGIFDITTSGDYRTLLYNEDYTLVNEYNAIQVHNPISIPAATSLPHTVIASQTNPLEERTISWQTFLAADRYVMPRDKGPIVNLQGVANDRLFIHQRDSLFITRSTTTIKADITDITLGSADLFSVTPTEVLSTDEGFGGTQHKYSCKLTKAGYAFCDAAQGKIFLHNGNQLDEISKEGQRIFFRDNIDKNVRDNPFIGTGITIAFDEKYNRLLFGYRNGIQSFTANYSPAVKAWGGWHDYFPDYLIQTRRKFYSLKNNATLVGGRGIYEHHNGPFGIYYNVIEDNPTPYPMIIDIVYNPDPYVNKTFGAIEWASEVIQATGLQAKDETIDYITLSNNNKTTGRVELEKLVNLAQIHGTNTRNVNEFWSFNALRDISVIGLPFRLDFYDDFAIIDANLDYNKPWYRKAKFIDRFIITRFEYSNLYNSKFSLLNHSPVFRKSYR